MKSGQADDRAATLDNAEADAAVSGARSQSEPVDGNAAQGRSAHNKSTHGQSADRDSQAHDGDDAPATAYQNIGPAVVAGGRVMRFAYASGSRPLEGYTIKRGIGTGGFGEVYFALSDAGKEVALKRIQRNLDVELRGVRQCLNLKHINLISLWDIRTNDIGESWVVMEYVPGESLLDVINAHPEGVPDDDVKTWFTSTAAGVAYLHEQGIVHRDLKPANIFYDSDQQVIKIGDYGLSKFISTSRRSGQTEAVGTFHYMAPEIGKGVYGREIDIYAMGIILFELLTGRVPFDGESSQEIMMKHLTADPILDGVPREFHNVIRKSMTKDPEQRYSNVPEMLCDVPWPDIAENSRKIITLNSVGPLVLNGHTDRKGVTTQEQAVQAQQQRPEHTGKQHPGTQQPTTPQPGSQQPADKRKPPSMLVNKRPDIIFGELRDTSAGAKSRTGAGRPVVEGIRVQKEIQVVEPQRVSISGDATVRSAPAKDAPAGKVPSGEERPQPARVPEEPIARAMHSGLWQFTDWWNNANVSTPLKIAILIGVTVAVVSNTDWLLPVALGAGVLYLVYYLCRMWMISGDKLDNNGTRKASRRQEIVGLQQKVRGWLAGREWNDRFMELLGSLLLAATACVVFNLLGLAIGSSVLHSDIEGYAMFAWMSITTVFASWAILVAGKYWENHQGDQWLRRLTLAAIGLATGFVAFATAGLLNIDLANLAVENPVADMSIKSIPELPAYLVLFTVIFGVLRWWRQTDPVRYTRLSLWNVGLCLVWAAVLSYALNFAPLWNCIMVVVVSIAVQLASPWMHPEEQTKVAREQAMAKS